MHILQLTSKKIPYGRSVVMVQETHEKNVMMESIMARLVQQATTEHVIIVQLPVRLQQDMDDIVEMVHGMIRQKPATTGILPTMMDVMRHVQLKKIREP